MAESEKQSIKEQLNEITARIEDGIKDLFQSDKYAQYLKTMSRFHNYSVNNTMLIFMQKPNATVVAGFNKWRDQFERHVKKGEKGIKILAPSPYKKKISEPKLDHVTDLPLRDKDGNIIYEEKTIKVPAYKPVSVFDVSQTYGKPLPTIVSSLDGTVEHYDAFMEAIKRSSPVPIDFKPLQAELDGFFDANVQSITLREGMSEIQTVCAAIHEMGHAKLHNYEKQKEEAAQRDENAEPPKPKDRRTEEVEAESVAFAVCAYFGIETGANSFGYIANWSSDKELPELKSSLDTIRQAASEIINDVDSNFVEICKERGIDLSGEAKTAELEKTVTIYQLNDTPEAAQMRFMNHDYTLKKGLSVDISKYNEVYSCPMQSGENLESIFRRFNVDIPSDFKGHSLSVSDVISIRENGKNTAYFVDSVGFKELPDFFKDKGTREKKPSVLKQIKSQELKERKPKSPPKKPAEREIL